MPQLSNELGKVYRPVRRLVPIRPSVGYSRPEVYSRTYSPKISSIYRVTFPIEQQIRWIKIDSQIIQSYVLNRSLQGDWSFLTGLKQEKLTVLLAVPGYVANGLHYAYVVCVQRIFGYKTNMSDKIRHPDFSAEIRPSKNSMRYFDTSWNKP